MCAARLSLKQYTTLIACSPTNAGVTASPTGARSTETTLPIQSSAKVSSGNEVTLPWPPSILSPNSRAHWAAKSKAAKAYRNEGAWLTYKAGLVVDWPDIVHVWITFCPPDKRHRDDDNLVAAFKSARDGIADALSINDKRFRMHPWLSDEVVKGGAVRVRLSKGPDE